MLKTRVIPALLLRDDALVKTVKFSKPSYIGDPINTVRIFNELEVDELVFLDIEATNQRRKPNLRILREIANECFMPLAYGGGVHDFGIASEIFEIGFEKVVLNSAWQTHPKVIEKIAQHYGKQSLVASVDVKKNFWGNYEVFTHSGSKNSKKNPVEWCKQLEEMGAGEILLTSIDREGTWSGFDLELIRQVSQATHIPLIAHGGAGSIHDIARVVHEGKASAVALGSMVVYQQKGMGVLVNFPDKQRLKIILNDKL
jgi:cyclase